MEKLKGFLSVKATADLCGVDPFTVQRWIWAKKLKALRKGRRWLIPASEAKRKFENRKVVMDMPNKRELQNRVEELEEKFAEARGIIDEALGFESDEEAEENESDSDDEDED